MSDDLYGVLGLSKGASDSEIKREYHKLARRYHPDKSTGTEEKFKEIQTAYEVLSDPQKREMYDTFGINSLRGEGSSGMPSFSFGGSGNGESVFSQLFGGGGDIFGGGGFGGGGRRRRQKAETMGIPLEVTLEELFNGATKSVEYKRKELCKSCRGAGGKQGSMSMCRKCHGSGVEVKLRQISRGMMQQMQSICSDCGGSGDFIREKDRCKKCKGKRVIEVDRKLEVPVSPGMKNEQKIPFRGQADQIPDGDDGDVIVVLQQMDHPLFKRQDLDLFVEKKITLRQALCGFSFPFEHLDGRKMTVMCRPGEVISPGMVQGLEGEGMSNYRHLDIRGNLYFVFDVEFPENGFLVADKILELEKLLPTKPDQPHVTEDMEEVSMIDFEGTRGADGGNREAYDDSDEEDGIHGQRVGCQQQ